MNIRKATTDDLDIVTNIESTCFPPAEAAPREAFKERLAHYADHFLIIFDGDTPIGFIDGFVTDDEILTDEMFADASMHNPDGGMADDIWSKYNASVSQSRCRGAVDRGFHRIGQRRKSKRRYFNM